MPGPQISIKLEPDKRVSMHVETFAVMCTILDAVQNMVTELECDGCGFTWDLTPFMTAMENMNKIILKEVGTVSIHKH